MTEEEATILAQAKRVAVLEGEIEALTRERNTLAAEAAKRIDQVRCLSGAMSAQASLLQSQLERLATVLSYGEHIATRDSVLAALWHLHHGMAKYGDAYGFKLQPEIPDGADEKYYRLNRRAYPFTRPDRWDTDDDSYEAWQDWRDAWFKDGGWLAKTWAIQEAAGTLLPAGSRDALTFNRPATEEARTTTPDPKYRRLNHAAPPFVRDADGDAPGPGWFTGDWMERAYQIQEQNDWLLDEGEVEETC